MQGVGHIDCKSQQHNITRVCSYVPKTHGFLTFKFSMLPLSVLVCNLSYLAIELGYFIVSFLVLLLNRL